MPFLCDSIGTLLGWRSVIAINRTSQLVALKKGIEMTNDSFVLPDSRDVKAVVSDYFDSLASKLDVSVEREKIISSCEKPFLLLINAWEMVEAGGGAEKQIWTAFMRDIAIARQVLPN